MSKRRKNQLSARICDDTTLAIPKFFVKGNVDKEKKSNVLSNCFLCLLDLGQAAGKEEPLRPPILPQIGQAIPIRDKCVIYIIICCTR